MRIYLDNCCFNRPYDDISQPRIRLEADAKLEVQALMRMGIVEYVWSGMLEREIGDSPHPERIARISSWGERAAVYVRITPAIEQAATAYEAVGLKHADAIHVAAAVAADCDWFLTTDKGIYRKLHNVGKMRIGTPIDYVEEAL